MKKTSRIISVLTLAIAGFLVSCSGDKSPENSDSLTTQEDSSHVHTFACPMHAEITGEEGDVCSKCGMSLTHQDASASANVYFIQFTCNPSTVEAGKEVSMQFTPKIKGKETDLVPLDVVHEKKIHLILVSSDLGWFDHLHPEFQADGSYLLKATFPSGGDYILFADYTPSGASHQVEKINIAVSGNPAKPTTYTAGSVTTWKNGDTEATLNPGGGKFVAGEQMHIAGVIKSKGKEVDANSMDNWLGAKGHMVIIKTGSYEYIHVHPEVENGHLDLHATFDTPGIYRGWLQFQLNGQLYTSDFVINVEPGSATSTDGHDHDGHDHEHSH